MPKLTMTLNEVYHAMREAGISNNPSRISAGIASGAYPFGRVVCVGETGRRTIEILRVDFEAWLKTRIPQEERKENCYGTRENQHNGFDTVKFRTALREEGQAMGRINKEALDILVAAICRKELWATPEETAEWLKTERGQRIAALIEEERKKRA